MFYFLLAHLSLTDAVSPLLMALTFLWGACSYGRIINNVLVIVGRRQRIPVSVFAGLMIGALSVGLEYYEGQDATSIGVFALGYIPIALLIITESMMILQWRPKNK